MDAALDIASWVCLTLGGLSVVVGTLGLLRLPDVFTRLHGASITDTLGAGLILLGLALQDGATLTSVKLLMVLVFLLLTSPVATYAVARAALTAGLRPRLDGEIDGRGAPAERGAEPRPADGISDVGGPPSST